MAEKKPFNMVVALVKTQIRAEKRLKKNDIMKCTSVLRELVEKYDWIHDPEKVELPQGPRGIMQQNPVRAQVSNAPAATRPKVSSARPDPEQLAVSSVPGDENRIACKYCGRKFAADRIGKHETVCPSHPDKLRKATKRGAMNMTNKRVGDFKSGAGAR